MPLRALPQVCTFRHPARDPPHTPPPPTFFSGVAGVTPPAVWRPQTIPFPRVFGFGGLFPADLAPAPIFGPTLGFWGQHHCDHPTGAPPAKGTPRFQKIREQNPLGQSAPKSYHGFPTTYTFIKFLGPSVIHPPKNPKSFKNVIFCTVFENAPLFSWFGFLILVCGGCGRFQRTRNR